MGTPAEAARELRGIAQRLNDMTPILRVVAADIRTKIDDSFGQSKSAIDGAPWADLSEATLMQRARRARGYNVDRTIGPLGPEAYDSQGRRRRTAKRWTRRVAQRVQEAVFSAKPELDTGRERQSITTQVGPRSLSFGSNAVYAAKQNFGDPSNTWGGHPAPVPARPFLLVEGARGAQTLAPDDFWTEQFERIEHWLATGEIR